MFMCEDATPITILAGYDGLTKAFFAYVVLGKGTSHMVTQTKHTRTGEHNGSNNATVVSCRSMRRRNEEERWNRDVL